MQIRRAELADADDIATVHVRSWQAAYRGLIPQNYLDGLDPARRRPVWERLLTETSWPRQGVLVAEVDGSIAGFAGIGPTRDHDEDPASTGEVSTIYLLPQVWGVGIGRRLMAAALESLTVAGYKQATLWVLDTNAQARRFYESNDWHADGLIKHDRTLGFTLTEIRYRRTLTRPCEEGLGVGK
ncbi:GNAT family N-acetyltransferase [Nonomuraea sp. NPDC005983]|uniref:GNAT family N-acetyltransferase n=1 Tax=Nonomuraea sp. NPDC005983 TaxID=3155595 RepID=UPI0033B90FA4